MNRDQWLENNEYTILIQENDWLIGDVNKSDLPSHPIVSHWCNKGWNYVFSTVYAMKAFRGDVLYKCNICREMAPDSIITIHTLYTL